MDVSNYTRQRDQAPERHHEIVSSSKTLYSFRRLHTNRQDWVQWKFRVSTKSSDKAWRTFTVLTTFATVWMEPYCSQFTSPQSGGLRIYASQLCDRELCRQSWKYEKSARQKQHESGEKHTHNILQMSSVENIGTGSYTIPNTETKPSIESRNSVEHLISNSLKNRPMSRHSQGENQSQVPQRAKIR